MSFLALGVCTFPLCRRSLLYRGPLEGPLGATAACVLSLYMTVGPSFPREMQHHTSCCTVPGAWSVVQCRKHHASRAPREMIASIREPRRSLQDIVASIREPRRSLQEIVASIREPRRSLQEIVASIREPRRSLQEIVASIREPRRSLQEIVASIQKPTVTVYACSCATVWEFCTKFGSGIYELVPNSLRTRFCHSKCRTFVAPPASTPRTLQHQAP